MAVRHFAAAPWPKTLKAISALGTAALVGASMVALRAIPASSGAAHAVGLGVAFVPPTLIILCLLFMVTGYGVSATTLSIQRPFWATELSIRGLQGVCFEPGICRKSFRIFGNAGLFGFTGLYRNTVLGRYRLFGTDLACSVVLTLPDRRLVITPAGPEAFVDHMRRAFALTDQAPPRG